MLENMPKPSMCPVSNHFQYAPSFIGMYQHLFVCHLLCPTDFQHLLPCPHFKCFQQLTTCFSQRPGLCCIQCYIPNCALYNSLRLLTVQIPCQQFNFSISNILPTAMLDHMCLNCPELDAVHSVQMPMWLYTVITAATKTRPSYRHNWVNTIWPHLPNSKYM